MTKAKEAGDDAGGGKTERKKKQTARILTPSNLTELTAKLADFFELMDKKKDDQEKMNGEFSVEYQALYERFANSTGHNKKLLTRLYTTHRRLKKDEIWRKEQEKNDLDAFDELMAAGEKILDTPLFRAAQERDGAPPKKPAKTEETTH